MRKSNALTEKIRINENTIARELTNVSKDCHCVT